MTVDVRKAMRQAFNLGQVYWMQADSDSYIQNKKSDATSDKLHELIEITVAGLEIEKEELND